MSYDFLIYVSSLILFHGLHVTFTTITFTSTFTFTSTSTTFTFTSTSIFYHYYYFYKLLLLIRVASLILFYKLQVLFILRVTR